MRMPRPLLGHQPSRAWGVRLNRNAWRCYCRLAHHAKHARTEKVCPRCGALKPKGMK